MNVNCKNCNNSFTGIFCNQCGQKASVSELALKDVIFESWHAITNTDSGILRLVKDLFVSPKSVYLNYFSGQRKKYFSPVTFFLLTVGILLFLMVKVYDFEDYKFRTFNEFGRFSLLETKFKTLLLLPFEIFFTWIFFRKHYNLGKNIVFWLYVNGFLLTVNIILIPFYFPFIAYKSLIDDFVQILQYIILLTHLILVFGNGKWKNIVLLFLITNLIIISDYALTGYLLFENKLFIQTGAENIFDLILKAYHL